jgi:hypothetical protein
MRGPAIDLAHLGLSNFFVWTPIALDLRRGVGQVFGLTRGRVPHSVIGTTLPTAFCPLRLFSRPETHYSASIDRSPFTGPLASGFCEIHCMLAAGFIEPPSATLSISLPLIIFQYNCSLSLFITTFTQPCRPNTRHDRSYKQHSLTSHV